MSLWDQISQLKQKHRALILAHYYEEDDIQDIADHVGDSLYLAQVGEKSEAPVILLAGVVFMAESVKILSPEKKVLVPDMQAGCSLVHHSPFERYLEWRRKYPEAIMVTYINSSAEVKGISDVICTSSNAEKIIRSVPENRQILFGPDRHLGAYLTKKLSREMELWPGSCEVHVLFSARKLFELKKNHPEARVLAHPECMEEILQYADVIGSTSRLIDEVKNHPAKEFIVATEAGIFHKMKKIRPDAKLIQAPAEGSCACNVCPYMRLNNLEKIKMTLESLNPEVKLQESIIERARQPLRRMMALTEGRKVSWPGRFDYAY